MSKQVIGVNGELRPMTRVEQQLRDWNVTHRRDPHRLRTVALIGGVVTAIAWPTVHMINNILDDAPATTTAQAPPTQTPSLVPFRVEAGAQSLECTIADRPYTVNPGDTLWSIAESQAPQSHVAQYVTGLEAINPQVDAQDISIGTAIKVFSQCQPTK